MLAQNRALVARPRDEARTMAAARPPRAAAVRVCARVSGDDRTAMYAMNIHGRHVDVDEGMERYIRERLHGVLSSVFQQRAGEFVEGEGGVRDVDVRLMNSQAELRVRPAISNKASHDTYLRMGELKVLEPGSSALDAFDRALLALEAKLKKLGKAQPVKKNLRVIGHRLGK